jgi:hypothetical protein
MIILLWRDNYSGTKDLLCPQDVDPDVRHLLAQTYLENSQEPCDVTIPRR